MLGASEADIGAFTPLADEATLAIIGAAAEARDPAGGVVALGVIAIGAAFADRSIGQVDAAVFARRVWRERERHDQQRR